MGEGQSGNPIGTGYPRFQLARALWALEAQGDTDTRGNAQRRVDRWEQVIEGVESGALTPGSRTPVKNVPAWATLEVVTGGFATGNPMAGGALREHEKERLARLGEVSEGRERAALNAYFLSEEGLAELHSWLDSGCYRVEVPEEGALLVVAWLARTGKSESARTLLGELSPYFDRLRFYPAPVETPKIHGTRVHLQTVGESLDTLRQIKPNPRILAQKESVEIWGPYHDRVAGLFLETYEEGQPCRRFPADWAARAQGVVGEYPVLRDRHRLCSKPDKENGHSYRLRLLLAKCAGDPGSLSEGEVGRVRGILVRYLAKGGAPGSEERLALRSRRAADVAGPTHQEIAGAVALRLEARPQDQGAEDVVVLTAPIGAAESDPSGIPDGTPVPESVQRRVERCSTDTLEGLIQRGLITSADTMARVLPQLTSGIRAAGIEDPTLRRLDAAIYRAFRRRRSLLLLNLESQVRLEELPWVRALEPSRGNLLTTRESARQCLVEVLTLALGWFPHAILPNKLLQELRTLAEQAELDVPWTDELATDIFMGRFSPKFVEALRLAAGRLGDSLYSTYYGLDYPKALRQMSPRRSRLRRWLRGKGAAKGDALATHCAQRAGVELGTWSPATNGMVLEQQQILTTQNLVSALACPGAVESLRPRFASMASDCFAWVCRKLQFESDDFRARLVAVKNSAYAWRQMVFYLSQLTPEKISTFLEWATAHLESQDATFQARFRPVLEGLRRAARGHPPSAKNDHEHPFLGWSNSGHGLIPKGPSAP